MYYFYDPLFTAASYLLESANYSMKEKNEIIAILEDAVSPITHKYLEKLYKSVIDKSHIDFDDIPNTKGEIVKYSGYTNLIEVLSNLMNLASEHKSQELIKHVQVIKETITIVNKNADLYKKAFVLNNEFIKVIYNLVVYNIIQATSALLYDYIDYVKKPEKTSYEISIKNTKYQASKFYLDQLYKFNEIEKSMNYRKYLENILKNGSMNFTGMEAIGLATVISISLAIIPIMRELVYRFYQSRTKLSECLAQQAYYLEMNKAIIESNQDFNKQKKDSILLKQEKIRNICLKLSDKIKVTHVKSMDSGKAALINDNKLLNLDAIKKEVNSANSNDLILF